MNKKYCSSCGAQLKDGQKFCENCGSQVSDMVVENITEEKIHKENQKNQSAGALLSLIFMIAGGYLGYWYFAKSGMVFSVDYSSKIEVSISKEYNSSYGTHYVEGTAKNNSDDVLESVTLYFSCVDKQGNIVEEIEDITNATINKNQTFNFEALTWGNDGKKIDHCEFTKADARKA